MRGALSCCEQLSLVAARYRRQMITQPAIDTFEQSTSGPGFAMGLITGGIIGTVLALAFAPRAGADLRRSVAGAAKKLGRGGDPNNARMRAPGPGDRSGTS